MTTQTAPKAKVLPAAISAVIGLVLGWAVNKHVTQPNIGTTIIFEQEGKIFNAADLANILLGLMLILFGSKIHRLVVYMGIGWFAWALGSEVAEFAGLW